MNDVVSPADVDSLMLGDLGRSGLVPGDIKARVLDATERLTCEIHPHIQGYVIPYYDLGGNPIGFYRAKLFDQSVKYKQVKDTPNHVYFPRNFLHVFRTQKFRPPIILLTEGEKKAAIACKRGFPCAAFGGVDSWRNKVLLIPKSTEFRAYRYNKDVITARIPEGVQEFTDSYAQGFEDLCNFGLKYGAIMMIVYDSDTLRGVKPEVQRAAASLGHELRHRGFGIDQIRQLILPNIEGRDNVSLDDYLVADDAGPNALHRLIRANLALPSSFPRHPNLRDYILKRLSAPRITRKEMQNLSLSILTELDAGGRRMFHPDSERYYYFDNATSELMRVDLNSPKRETLQDTSFGRLLYRDYGVVPAADSRLTQWLGAQFTAEEPIAPVDPYKVLSRPSLDAKDPDSVCYQISNGQYVRVSRGPFEILDNGTSNMLFESNSVVPIEANVLSEEISRVNSMPLTNWWHDVLSQVRLLKRDNHQKLISLLYYISPWLYRWRGTQLPVELITGEPGSGKSTLAELRMNVILGESKLRNVPNDIKDWVASAANAGAIHVTDNVQMAQRDMRIRISDEICRLVTEPNPHIETRKYYTEADLIRIKVNTVFVFTSIMRPFHAADLLQRAITLELDKSSGLNVGQDVEYDSVWITNQLEHRGGRVAWVAHHLLVLHKFFQAVHQHWDRSYKAKYRLINFEQALTILCQHVFGEDASWIPDHLNNLVSDSVISSDMGLTGLCAFVDERLTQGYLDAQIGTKEIAEWAATHDDYKHNNLLTNSRSLSHYMTANKYSVASVAGLVESGKYANRTMYKIVKTARHKKR